MIKTTNALPEEEYEVMGGSGNMVFA